MNDVDAYVQRSIALAFERRDAYHIECKAGYRICKTSSKTGGAYTASKAGKIVTLERFTTPDEQKAALQRCKEACERHYAGAEPVTDAEYIAKAFNEWKP